MYHIFITLDAQLLQYYIMYLVKLNATNSTNAFLKKMSKEAVTPNWTVVTAEYQYAGRGQINTKWHSDEGKNLICSVLIRFDSLNIKDQFYLNCAISLGIFKVLEGFNIPQLKIKWPNDIMSGNKKMGGILIENSLMVNRIHQSVIGIGLNVNQDEFANELPHAVSMKQIKGEQFNRVDILEKIISSIKKQIKLLSKKEFKLLHQNYEKCMYKINTPHMFSENMNKKFLGKIVGVSSLGKLIIELEDESVKEFNFKEVIYLE